MAIKDLRGRIISVLIVVPIVFLMLSVRTSALFIAGFVGCVCTDEYYRIAHAHFTGSQPVLATGDRSAVVYRASRVLACIAVGCAAETSFMLHVVFLCAVLVVIIMQHLMWASASPTPLNQHHYMFLCVDLTGALYTMFAWFFCFDLARFHYGVRLCAFIVIITGFGECGGLFMGNWYGSTVHRWLTGVPRPPPSCIANISPNKSYAGFVGQIVWSIVVCFGYIHVNELVWRPKVVEAHEVWSDVNGASMINTGYQQHDHDGDGVITTGLPFTRRQYMELSVLIAVVGIVGDLFESFFKRCFAVKDVAKLLPGWGGILDRVDGLIFAFPACYVYMLYQYY